MKRFLIPFLVIALIPQTDAFAQVRPAPSLAAAIADGAPFVVQLNPGENNGTLLGGDSYAGQYNIDSNTFTVSGRGLRDDGVIIPVTATYGGAEPKASELSVWGSLYTFDSRGNLFLGTSGRLSGKVLLQR